MHLKGTSMSEFSFRWLAEEWQTSMHRRHNIVRSRSLRFNIIDATANKPLPAFGLTLCYECEEHSHHGYGYYTGTNRIGG